MLAYHGTGKKFDAFDLGFVGTGEGVAKRGVGINCALDFEVSKHFALCAASKAYVCEVAVPDTKDLLNLDDLIETSFGYHLVFAAHEYLTRDVDEPLFPLTVENIMADVFEHAEEMSMGYPDERAEQMLCRVLIDGINDEAWDGLREWASDYDWDGLQKRVEKNSIEFAADATNDKLLEYLYSTLGDKANEFLLENGIYGTIGKEPISNDPNAETAYSLVVFRPEDAIIKTWHTVKEPRPSRDMSP